MPAVGNGRKPKDRTPEVPAEVPLAAIPPHGAVFRNVYVNDIGKNALLGSKTAAFPVGSVIVREAIPDIGPRTPNVIDVMVKRPIGFNPKTGDWEFIVFDGQGNFKKVTGPDNACAKCHLRQAKSDFVFRDGLAAGKDTR